MICWDHCTRKLRSGKSTIRLYAALHEDAALISAGGRQSVRLPVGCARPVGVNCFYPSQFIRFSCLANPIHRFCRAAVLKSCTQYAQRRIAINTHCSQNKRIRPVQFGKLSPVGARMQTQFWVPSQMAVKNRVTPTGLLYPLSEYKRPAPMSDAAT
jgi:hypothetical protein